MHQPSNADFREKNEKVEDRRIEKLGVKNVDIDIHVQDAPNIKQVLKSAKSICKIRTCAYFFADFSKLA